MSEKKSNYKILIRDESTNPKVYFAKDLSKVKEIEGISMHSVTIMISEKSLKYVEKNQNKAVVKAKNKFSVLNDLE